MKTTRILLALLFAMAAGVPAALSVEAPTPTWFILADGRPVLEGDVVAQGTRVDGECRMPATEIVATPPPSGHLRYDVVVDDATCAATLQNVHTGSKPMPDVGLPPLDERVATSTSSGKLAQAVTWINLNFDRMHHHNEAYVRYDGTDAWHPSGPWKHCDYHNGSGYPNMYALRYCYFEQIIDSSDSAGAHLHSQWARTSGTYPDMIIHNVVEVSKSGNVYCSHEYEENNFHTRSYECNQWVVN